MKRRLINLLTLLSLLLCVAVVGLWVRSYGRGDAWTVREREGPQCFSDTLQLESSRGGLTEYRSQSSAGPPPQWCRVGGGTAPDSIAETLGFSIRYSAAYSQVFNTELNGTLGTYHREVRVPYWSFFSLSSVVPALRIASAMRRRHRKSIGLCSSCGYDLRATADRCPECGHAPAGATA